LAVTAVTTATLLPFVQTIATKAGEEVWPKIAGLIRPERRAAITKRLADADLVELVAQDRHLIITLPKRLSAEAARHLRDVVDTLQDADGWYRLSYDAASRSWEIVRADDERGRIEIRPPDD
jgi:YD repeat-containing protein